MHLNNLLQTQEERMGELNLFIEHYSKYIVSIIWQRYILTLHLSHANCCKALNASCSCCQFFSYMLCNFYLIESYQSSLIFNPLVMLNIGTLILLYFANTYGIILPCLKLKLLISQTEFRVTKSKIWNTLKVRNFPQSSIASPVHKFERTLNQSSPNKTLHILHTQKFPLYSMRVIS